MLTVGNEPEAGALAVFDAAGIEPVYQPIFDLRDGSVVGYEALARGRGGNGLASPEALFSAARAQGRVAELDRACREAALAGAIEGGLGAPFCLFVNADASALEADLPGTPRAGFTLVMEVTERALTERPEPLLRALTELRRRGWGPPSAPRPSSGSRRCWRRGSTPSSSSRPRALPAPRSARATCSASRHR